MYCVYYYGIWIDTPLGLLNGHLSSENVYVKSVQDLEDLVPPLPKTLYDLLRIDFFLEMSRQLFAYLSYIICMYVSSKRRKKNIALIVFFNNEHSQFI